MAAAAPYLQKKESSAPLKIVGGNKFGRYPKISEEQTWNMIVSDNFLVPYAGYEAKLLLDTEVQGRGLYASKVEDFMISIVGLDVFRISSTASSFQSVGTLDTVTGEVYITENNAKQILITDGAYIYIYDYSVSTSPVFYSSKVGSTNYVQFGDPDLFTNSGYCSFQNGRFIVAVNGTNTWVLSGENDGLSWSSLASSVGSIQTKPGYIQGAIPVPGGGNNLLILGTDVGESWQDVGAALFPYQRNSTFNIDYGCINPASIAELENMIVWVAVNEQTGPVIMYAQGSHIQTISTDGINFKLADLNNPSNCTGFLFKQDGHLIYQITFLSDNLTYAYDFNTQLFFTITDEKLNYHPARQVVFFNNEYYFVSLQDGVLYQFGTQFSNYKNIEDVEHIIPRIRVTPPLRLVTQRYFIARSLGFTIENGEPNDYQTVIGHTSFTGNTLATENLVNIISTESGNGLATEDNTSEDILYEISPASVDLSLSRDGGASFGSGVRLNMNRTGKRKSRFIYQRLGMVNDVNFQLRFNGFRRFLCTDGEVEAYQ